MRGGYVHDERTEYLGRAYRSGFRPCEKGNDGKYGRDDEGKDVFHLSIRVMMKPSCERLTGYLRPLIPARDAACRTDDSLHERGIITLCPFSSDSIESRRDIFTSRLGLINFSIYLMCYVSCYDTTNIRTFAYKTNKNEYILQTKCMRVDKSLILNKIKSYKGFRSDAEFARFLEISPQGLASWHKRNSFDINKIEDKIPELNTTWLLTGEGDMLKHIE